MVDSGVVEGRRLLSAGAVARVVVWLVVAVAGAVMLLGAVGAREAAAAPGDLDFSFNPSGKPPGTVTTDVNGSFNAVVIQPGGKIVAAGSRNGEFALARYNANGSLDTSFGRRGIVTTDVGGSGSEANSVALQPDGKIVAAGSADFGSGEFQFALARYNEDGSLDTSFGSGGIILDNAGGSFTSEANAVVLQPDGKIVAAGLGGVGPDNQQFVLTRYNADGSPDTSFGDEGVVTTDVGGSETSEANAVVLQPDGKIVAAGYAAPGSSTLRFALARYNTDGSLDTSFGDDGTVTTDIRGSLDSAANAVALQPDGKIIAAGFAIPSLDVDDREFALARYDEDGTLDNSFGSGGTVTTDISGAGESEAKDVILQPNGKIVTAGYAFDSSNTQRFALARYNANGSLDTSFGRRGIVTTDVGGSGSEANSVALQPDGRIVAVGAADTGVVNQRFALARYNADGSLDTSFNSKGGVVVTDIGGSGISVANAVALQPDGKIVAAGFIEIGGSGEFRFALARYNEDGLLDTSFGSGGIVTTDVEGSGDSAANAVAIQRDGKIVAAGRVTVEGTERKFALVRYDENGSIDTSFGTEGIVTTDVGGSGNSEANDVALQRNGRIVAAGLASPGSNRQEFALARYTANGSLDTSFGGGGTVTTDVGGSGISAANAVAIQPNGRIVAAGLASPGSNRQEFALARYNASGSRDVSFGRGGTVITNVGGSSDSTANAVAIQPNGKILAAGSNALARYNASGSLDTSFGRGGIVTTNVGGNALAIEPGGKIVVAGSRNGDFALARYNSDGSRDISFGSRGIVTTDVGGTGASTINDVVLQPDGKIVVAGTNGQFFTLARYEGGSQILTPTDKANLSLTKKANKKNPRVGQKLTYTLRVKNNGPDAARNVRVVDTLPGRVKATSSRGCRKVSGRKVVCNIGSLADGRSVARKITVKVNRPGKLVNRARASSSVSDPNGRNNRARAIVRVKPKVKRAAPRFKQISCKVKDPTVRLVQGKQVVVADSKPGKSVGCVVQGDQLALARSLKNKPLGLVRQGGKQVSSAKGKVVKAGGRKVVVRVPRGF
ncbi:MAG: hypothetical protein ACFB50_12750 [Rubrobacteraceae bacterium]